MRGMRGQRLLKGHALLRQAEHAKVPRHLEEALLAVVHPILRLLKRPARQTKFECCFVRRFSIFSPSASLEKARPTAVARMGEHCRAAWRHLAPFNEQILQT